MICDACRAENCEVCTGVVFAERKQERPCTCPDSIHDSPRRVRKFTDEIPPVQTIQVVNGVPLIGENEEVNESAYFWREVARDLKLRLDRIKLANEGNKNSRKKLKRQLAEDD